MITTVKGVILQATYRVTTQPSGRRVPVIHLYGRLEDGGTFLVRDNRQEPEFYIRAVDAARASAIIGHPIAVGQTGGSDQTAEAAHIPTAATRQTARAATATALDTATPMPATALDTTTPMPATALDTTTPMPAAACTAGTATTSGTGAATKAPATRLKRDFTGAPVTRVSVTIPSDVPALRDRLHAAGIDTFEADVRFPIRYLIERGIKGACIISGPATAGKSAPKSPVVRASTNISPDGPRVDDGSHGSGTTANARSNSATTNDNSPPGVALTFDNPSLTPTQLKIEPRVLSFDIETDPKAERLLAISLYGPTVDEVLIVDGSGRPMPEKAIRCVDERAALTAFCNRVKELDPDVFTGWNTIDFDFTVLQRIATRLRHPFVLGRDTGELRIRRAEGYFGSGQATIPGRLVLDGIDLLRGAFVRMEDYSLDAVARVVLGEGKALESNAKDRLAEIIHNYRHNLPAFALYARTDARLAYDIVSKLDLIRLAFARSQLAGMTPDRVAASIASFDFVYLSELEKRGIVAATVRSDDSRVFAAQHGGHVLEPVAGLHRNVWVFDFKSLYPNIIRTFNIDPLTYVETPEAGADSIDIPGGSFQRVHGILPGLLDDLFPRREAAKKAGDAVAAQSIKILMNSFYGVLGTSACRFYNPALANSITGSGREILLWSKRWFEDAGFRVLYGDTDSLFVGSGSLAEPPPEQGLQLAAKLNEELTRYIQNRWNVQSRLELEFEKTYLRLILPHARHSTRGASKRYAGLLRNGAESTVEFVGMEVVRSDWTALAKQVQRELYQRLFTDQPVDVYLADIVRALRDGALDHLLVYRKSLRKGTETYTATTPPHVAAARKSPKPQGKALGKKVIEYMMTTGGPEPLDNIQHPPDREHYVSKQIRPVAEPVLATLGLDFDTVVGDGRQGELPF